MIKFVKVSVVKNEVLKNLVFCELIKRSVDASFLFYKSLKLIKSISFHKPLSLAVRRMSISSSRIR